MKIGQINHEEQLYMDTQILPSYQEIKVYASIKHIGGRMWFYKNGRYNWCLKLSLTNKNTATNTSSHWLKATSFEKAASIIMFGSSADDAQKNNDKNQRILQI